MITAPFNFVPLSDKVFFPDWAEQVSHDIPFEDSQSGTIDITITAKSPMFIRNHSDDRDNPSTEFCNHNGAYYIPSTSVKGMVRSVLEILSFSKIPMDNKTHSKTTSVRDMTNRKELVGTADGCGFLKKDENNHWIIIDYGKPRTIEYDIGTKCIGTLNCDFDTAQEKYRENGTYSRVSVIEDMKDLYDRNDKYLGKKRVATINGSQNNAYLVLTGGIDNKKNEFVFADSDKASTIEDIEKAVDKFKKVYFESDSIDGNFWKDNYDPNIGTPIFYKKDGNVVTDIGLSQLFKLAYSYTINGATKQIMEIVTRGKNKKRYHKLDLAQTIFGTIQEELLDDKKSKKETFALKGRVQFSHFKCDLTPEDYDEVYTVLGSPNPSFYPEYIQQNCKDDGKVQNDKYNTLMDKTSKIAGWKRYPLRYGKPNFIKADDDTDSATTFTPLGDYNGNKFNEFTFSGKVRFHNLKKAEIGALVSALTFHNNQDKFYHNIGMAKSLGFGKIKI
ncbi:MAG: TIGR03986 family CRISPR-associated RAMP protein, partial [Campylobacterota bacterium]|nr:TIGR03986 family CRISPR-associated RAMP protein [Campylobacterota bacterium]